MAKVLFITTKDIKKHTIMKGSVDPDNFIHYILISQDIHIQSYLGTDLYVKLQDLIKNNLIDDSLYADYKYLLETHIKPMLIHWSMVDYLPFAAFTMSNKGIYKSKSEDSELADKEEIDFLTSKERNIAEHYTRRFIDYIAYNQAKFPEYNTNDSDDVYPNDNASFNGLYLDY
jgi:hypothetical protein